ncbi:alpha/beta fold hydrolase [Kiritimatiella glycovorans]|uniref:EF hand repeat-containing protein n=1 Tax=Kiritimatiella glycovorans TaxID=1307763 RepID=A0A0G3EJJ7_9BACT|nr:alpha/beta fold hydrolase [Kiritimatiella glycovorans]AKJ65622.1 EF hand repeat-containing protein [Kiritimatiella glycovorans]
MRLFRSLCYLYLLTCLAGVAAGQDGSRLRQGFERLDTDANSRLSQTELNAAPRLSSRLKNADSDNDGTLTFEEFATAIARSMRPGPNPGPDPRPGNESLSPGDHIRTVTVGEVQRRYRLHVPASYDPEKETPVVIAFHGGGGNPDAMVRVSRLDDKSEEAGFLVAYPFGSGPDEDRMLTFNGGECCGYAMHREIDDVGFVRTMLDNLEEVANVDSGAVFATGLSNGGIMSYRVAAELADRIAAIAPVGGPLMMETIAPSRPVAVMHFHGTADKFAPFKGGFGENGRGGRGVTEFRSVDRSLQLWIQSNGCDDEPTVTKLPDTKDDGTRVTQKNWGNGREGTEVVLIEIEGGGHTWPGVAPPAAAAFLGLATRDISANDLMWDFFLKHRRKLDGAAKEPIGGAKGAAMELLRTPDSHFADLPGYDFEPRYLSVDDPNLPPGNRRIRMHYAVSGPEDAPTLLMLHGNPSWSFLFRKIVPPINQAGYRTIMIDYVGHGRSDKPANESDSLASHSRRTKIVMAD